MSQADASTMDINPQTVTILSRMAASISEMLACSSNADQLAGARPAHSQQCRGLNAASQGGCWLSLGQAEHARTSCLCIRGILKPASAQYSASVLTNMLMCPLWCQVTLQAQISIASCQEGKSVSHSSKGASMPSNM